MMQDVRAWGNLVSVCRAHKDSGVQRHTRIKGNTYILQYKSQGERLVATFTVVDPDHVVVDTFVGKREDELRNVQFPNRVARYIYRQLLDGGFIRVQ